MIKVAEQVRTILSQEDISVAIANARFVKPIDTDYISEAAKRFDMIVTLEENVISGGFGENVLNYLNEIDYDGDVINIAIPDQFVTHGNVDTLLQSLEMDAASISEKILNKYIKED